MLCVLELRLDQSDAGLCMCWREEANSFSLQCNVMLELVGEETRLEGRSYRVVWFVFASVNGVIGADTVMRGGAQVCLTLAGS